MHWKKAENLITKLGLDPTSIKNDKLASAEIRIDSACTSQLKAYHPDKKIETSSKKFQEISDVKEMIDNIS